jgi:hypothetical protein
VGRGALRRGGEGMEKRRKMRKGGGRRGDRTVCMGMSRMTGNIYDIYFYIYLIICNGKM